MSRDVLVFFVADPVDDELAAAVRARVAALRHAHAWSCPAPGFFDDPAADDAAGRTTGGYVRSPGAHDAELLWEAIVDASRELGVTFELQWRETVLGHVRGGRADEGLRETVMGAV
jgi:hypothetical protein